MRRYLTEKEINEAKADKSIRDKIKAAMEEDMETGKMRLHYIDEAEPKMARRVATEDAIRTFCDANGDLNPLYRNRDYAKNSIFGGLTAPPHFLSTIAPFSGMGGRKKIQPDFATTSFDAGCQVEWLKIVRENDEFTIFDIPIEAADVTKEHTPIRFLIRGKRIYKNQKDEVVAVVNGKVIETVVRPPGEKQGIKEPPRSRYFSEQEVEEWYHLTRQEEIRGADHRFWEDVNVGDTIPPTHHVFTMMENVAFMVGRGRTGNWRLMMDQRKDTWQESINPESGLPDFAGIHMTDISAQRMGVPAVNCAGAQMCNWLGKLVTNWMGDTGFLKKMDVEYRRFLWGESMALCKGEVVKKYVENNEHLVDLHISVEDHNGDLAIPNGSATIVLPSRYVESWKS